MDIFKELGLLGIDNKNIHVKWRVLKESNLSVEKPILKRKVVKIFNSLQDNLFNNKPVLGVQKWHVIDVIFLKNNFLAVLLEDGHIMNCGIFKYEDGLENFKKILELKH